MMNAFSTLKNLILICCFFSISPLHSQVTSFILEQQQTTMGDSVRVCLMVENFEEIFSIQFTLDWDENIISYVGVDNFGLNGLSDANFNTQQTNDGKLLFTWFELGGDGVSLADSTSLFCLYFTAIGEIGDSSLVSFGDDPVPVEVGIVDTVDVVDDSLGLVQGKVEIVESLFQVQPSITNNPCFGDTLGSIEVQVSGGEMPYRLGWTGPNGFTANSSTINQLESGTYVLSIRDSLGRSDIFEFEVAGPSAPLDFADISIANANCGQEDGLIVVSASGGTAPYLFDIGNGFSAMDSFPDLAIGEYMIMLRDSNNCTADTLLNLNTQGSINLDLGPDINLCAVDSVLLSTDSNLLNYNWFLNDIPLSIFTPSIVATQAGTYRVEAESTDNCIATGSININSITLSYSNIDISEVNCGQENGVITLTASGGTAPYLYDFGNGFSELNRFDNLPIGDYTILVRDSNNCVADTMINLGSQGSVSLNLGGNTNLCPGGSSILTTDTGLLGYNWFLNDIPLSGSNASIEISQAGIYRVEAMTTDDCPASGQINVNEVFLSFNIDIAEATCGQENGAFTITTTGGSAPYLYDFGDGFSAQNRFENLAIGEYTIVVQDSNNCSAETVVSLNTQGSVEVDLGENMNLCPGDSTIILADPNLVNYTWFLNNSPLAENGPTLTVRQAGTYRLAAETIDNCPANGFVVINDASLESGIIGDVSIFRGDSISLFANAGLAYEWSPSNSLSCDDCQNPIAFPTETTSYLLRLISNDGCTIQDSVNVEVNLREGESFITPITFFSPNGDGSNDELFFPGLENYQSNELKIISRWGQILYSKVDYQINSTLWDGTLRGKPLPAGIYYYVLSVDEPKITIKRTLTIVRD